MSPRRPFPTLQTDRFTISPLEHNDAYALHELTDHPEITGVIHFLPSPFTLKDAYKLIEESCNTTAQFLSVRFKEDTAMVALIGSHFHENNTIEIGYWVHPHHHRKGIAYEAICHLINTLRTLYPQRLIVAECREANIPSWKLLEKIGFKSTHQDGHRPGRKLLLLHPS